MGNIQQRAQQLLGASITDNSKRVYKNALTALTKFQVEHNLTKSWPVSTTQTILFISSCFEKGHAPSTIRTYISGISFHHKILNLPDPTEVFIIRKLLEGCRRLGHKQDDRAPITGEILTKICAVLPSVCSSQYEAVLFKAAYTIAYFGLLRVSEVVFTTQNYSERPLQVGDINVEDSGQAINLTIRVSKTNQCGIPTILRIPASQNKTICCIRAMQQYMSRRNPADQGILFCHSNHSPVTRSQFSGVLAKAIARTGLPASKFRSHSFRIGRATSLAMLGVSGENIKKMGRWKSNVFSGYVRVAK